MRLVKASQITMEDLIAIWGERIFRKHLHYIAGRKDVGKGVITAQIAADCSMGRDPGSDKQVRKPIRVLYASHEDDYGSMTVPRMKAAGADMDMIEMTTYNLALQMKELAHEVTAGEFGLVIVDPLAAFLGNGVSRFNDSIRKVTTPLRDLMESTGCAFIAVDHVTKGVKPTSDPIDAVAGSSSGFGSACRMGFLFGIDPEDGDRRMLANVKHNICEERETLVFEMDSVDVEVERGKPDGTTELIEKSMPKLLEQGTEWIDPIRLVVGRKTGEHAMGRPADKQADACEWLTNYLFHSYSKAEGYPDYPPKGTQVFEDAKIAGMAERTLRRAADAMHIVKSAKGGHNVTWRLPDEVIEMLTGVVGDPVPEVAAEPVEEPELKRMLDAGNLPYGMEETDVLRNAPAQDVPGVPDEMDAELQAMLGAVDQDGAEGAQEGGEGDEQA